MYDYLQKFYQTYVQSYCTRQTWSSVLFTLLGRAGAEEALMVLSKLTVVTPISSSCMKHPKQSTPRLLPK